MRLTDLTIKALRPPSQGGGKNATSATKQKTYFDDHMKGFGIRVSVGGSKTFVVMFGQRRSLRSLGRYPDMTLAEARVEAKKALGEVAGQENDAPSRAKSLSFAEVQALFLKDTAPRTKSSTFDEYVRLLNKHFPFDKPISDVRRKDIADIIDGLRERPSAAHHAFVAIRTVMNWAKRHGHVEHSPVPPFKFKANTRSRFLKDEELVAVWNRAQQIGYPYGTLVQLLILTGQRRGEIAGLRRSWISRDTITYPAGFCKNKREHVVPLAPMAQAIINDISKTDDLLFPASRSHVRGKPTGAINGWPKYKRNFDSGLDGVAPYTLHDLRRTFSSQLAALGTPIHVTEKLLNHVSGTVSGVAAVYNRYSYATEMRAAVEAFEVRLEELLAKSA
jgi:integrase